MASVAPLACGGKSDSSQAKSAASVSGDVASLSVFVVKDRNADSDPYAGDAVKAVSASLAGAGYQVVDSEKAGDVFARVGVSKQQEQSLFQVSVNGKTQVNYKVSVVVELVDRDGKEVVKAEGSYSSSEGEADQGEVAGIVNKLSESPALAKYATASKVERAERAKKEAAERTEAEAAQATQEKRKATEKEEREAKARAEGTLREAATLEREIDSLIKKAEGPIPEDKLKALKSAIDKLKDQSPGDGAYYAQLYTTYLLENTWWMPEAEGPAAIARTLSSDLVSSGVNDAKKLSVTFNAKAGSCYSVLLRYKTPGGKEEINKIAWSAKGGNTPLQRYYVPWGPGSYDMHGTQKTIGTCVTKDVPVTLTADLVFAGTKNGLRYAVISSPKAKFPLHLATYLSIDIEDVCDTEAWSQLWSDPIPGTVVYSDKEPFLLARPDRAGQLWVNLWNATRGETRAQKPGLVTAPPKPVKFSTQFKFPGCSKEKAEGVDSTRYVKCHAQIDAKYKGQYEAAERVRDNAILYVGRRAAEATLNRLNEADERDREQQCKPIEDQIAKKWEAVFNKIVDTYTDSPQKSPIDRAGELKSQDKH